jgi:hypothetical protein
MDYSKYEKGFNEYWDRRIDVYDSSSTPPIVMNLMYSEALRAWERSGRDELLARCKELEKAKENQGKRLQETILNTIRTTVILDISEQRRLADAVYESVLKELDK